MNSNTVSSLLSFGGSLSSQLKKDVSAIDNTPTIQNSFFIWAVLSKLQNHHSAFTIVGQLWCFCIKIGSKVVYFFKGAYTIRACRIKLMR
jgi:hypothetical protein